ncbi:alpha/beta fold hydrolase [Micromonospora endophytica]|nr:alpha/beta hydrolase [Micromonospora endophytica]
MPAQKSRCTEIVPGAGHGLSLERPELVNQRILDFAASCSPDGSTTH